MNTSRTGKVRLFFSDAERSFQLRVEELMTLQELNNAGPMTILTRLRADGDWRVQDITNVLRLGLIGAGMEDERASELVARSVRSGAIRQYLPTATAVVFAALIGVEDDPVEEPGSGEPKAPAETPAPKG